MAGRYPAQLSGGQQQRVGVARALAADPPVMLMDEPFSAVDPVVREQLQDEFLRLQSELGKTILFVTHDIDEAVKLGDQVAVLRVGGKLAQLAAPAKLLADPVDDFVADFVGRDRGYRALQLPPAPELPLADEPHDAARRRRPTTARRRSGWVLVGRRRAAAARAGCAPKASTARSDPELLHRGGTVAPAVGLPARRCSTPRCPHPRSRASSSTTTAGSSARSPRHEVVLAIEARPPQARTRRDAPRTASAEGRAGSDARAEERRA